MQLTKLAPDTCTSEEIFTGCTKICQELQVIGKDQDLIIRLLALRERLACGVNTLQQRTIAPEDEKYLHLLEKALQETDTNLVSSAEVQSAFTIAVQEAKDELRQLVKVYEDMRLYDDFEDDYAEIASQVLRNYMDIVWSGEHQLLNAQKELAAPLHQLFKKSFFAFAAATEQLATKKQEEFDTPFWWFTTDPQVISQQHYDTAFDNLVAPCFAQPAPMPEELQQALAEYAQDKQQFSLNIDTLKGKIGKSVEWLRQQGSLTMEALCSLPLADNVMPVAAQQNAAHTSGKLFICTNGAISDMYCIAIDFFEYSPDKVPAIFAAKVDTSTLCANSQLCAIWETTDNQRTIKATTRQLDTTNNRILIEFDEKLDTGGRLLISIFTYE